MSWTFGEQPAKLATQRIKPIKPDYKNPVWTVPTPITTPPRITDYANVTVRTPLGNVAPIDLRNVGIPMGAITTPKVTASGGGGGGVGWGYLVNGTWGKLPAGTWKPAGDEVVPTVPTWSSSYSVPNAPSWWKGMTYSGEDANSKYAMMLNALIPSLSPEDQRTMATYLYQTFNAIMPDAFSAYNPEVANYGAIPKINTELQAQYTSKKRATDALSALDSMVTGAGKPVTSFGEGYTYLRSLLGTMGSFGGESAINKQTREQVVQQLGAVSPLLAQAKGTLAPYASIAQALTTPFFSSGSVMPISKDAKGNYIFGDVNKRLY